MGKVRVTKYGHAIWMSMFGLWFSIAYNSLLLSFLGGLLIGYGLRLAFQAGQESNY
jgi:hypothetical protein